MKIIKRNGTEANFDANKIKIAIQSAQNDIDDNSLTEAQVEAIASKIEETARGYHRALGVEEIQDMVEKEIMAYGAYTLACHYIKYRYEHSLVRATNSTDDRILSLINGDNEEAKQENSNKNPVVCSTQRDYMAGEISRDLTQRVLLPQDIVDAHNDGIIHFHDSDYYAQRMFNCCLINLNDMFQNGTVISGTKIETPHRFVTACNIATQIVAQVSSNQFGLK